MRLVYDLLLTGLCRNRSEGSSSHWSRNIGGFVANLVVNEPILAVERLV